MLQREVNSSDSSEEDTQFNSTQSQNSTMETPPGYWNITTEYTTEYPVTANSTASGNATVTSFVTTDNNAMTWSHSPRPPQLSTFPTPVITAVPTIPTELTTTARPLPVSWMLSWF